MHKMDCQIHNFIYPEIFSLKQQQQKTIDGLKVPNASD